VAFFTGRTVSAREVLLKGSTSPLFVIDQGTSALYLPPEGLVSAIARGDALDLVGDFSRVARSNEVSVSPIDSRDAVDLAAALASRYELPRRPLAVPAERLVTLTHLTYVRVRGAYTPGHFEESDFEGVKLSRHDGIEPRRRYVVEGFLAPHDGGPLHPGYNGAYLRVLRIEPA